MVRRRLSDGELAFYRCWSPRPVPLCTVVEVTGTRWCAETFFQTDMALGLDEHQLRRWDTRYRHTTLVMLAHAILTVIAARSRALQPSEDLAQASIINEIRHLLRQFAKLTTKTVHHHDHPLTGLSPWRRRHETRARTNDCRRQGHLTHQHACTYRTHATELG